jgi:ATP-dependent helicase/nuclease subunit A
MLEWQYEFDAATKRAAKTSVTTLRRQAADDLDDEAEQVFGIQSSAKRLAGVLAPPAQNPKSEIRNPKLSATDVGTAAHKFLQHVSFESAADVKSLEAEAKRLEADKILSADEAVILDLKLLENFWNSEIGRKILSNAAFARRELAFTAKFSPNELDEILATKTPLGLENEFVVVQGVADLAVLLPEEIWLLDFKTDEVRANELAGKIKIYEPQLKLYASALKKIYSRPVTNCWLHFLSARKTADVKI